MESIRMLTEVCHEAVSRLAKDNSASPSSSQRGPAGSEDPGAREQRMRDETQEALLAAARMLMESKLNFKNNSAQSNLASPSVNRNSTQQIPTIIGRSVVTAAPGGDRRESRGISRERSDSRGASHSRNDLSPMDRSNSRTRGGVGDTLNLLRNNQQSSASRNFDVGGRTHDIDERLRDVDYRQINNSVTYNDHDNRTSLFNRDNSRVVTNDNRFTDSRGVSMNCSNQSRYDDEHLPERDQDHRIRNNDAAEFGHSFRGQDGEVRPNSWSGDNARQSGSGSFSAAVPATNAVGLIAQTSDVPSEKEGEEPEPRIGFTESELSALNVKLMEMKETSRRAQQQETLASKIAEEIELVAVLISIQAR